MVELQRVLLVIGEIGPTRLQSRMGHQVFRLKVFRNSPLSLTTNVDNAFGKATLVFLTIILNSLQIINFWPDSTLLNFAVHATSL
jgi:hypothetical protein